MERLVHTHTVHLYVLAYTHVTLEITKRGCWQLKKKYWTKRARNLKNGKSSKSVQEYFCPIVSKRNLKTNKILNLNIAHVAMYAKKRECVYTSSLHTEDKLHASEIDLSHRCHNGQCWNPKHLSFEPSNVIWTGTFVPKVKKVVVDMEFMMIVFWKTSKNK